MTTSDKQYNYLVSGNRIEIKKIYRNRTQFEYYLKIFMGDSDYESILNYQAMFLTKKRAISYAQNIIFNAPKPRIERVIF
jgi:hypothetical protein